VIEIITGLVDYLAAFVAKGIYYLVSGVLYFGIAVIVGYILMKMLLLFSKVIGWTAGIKFAREGCTLEGAFALPMVLLFASPFIMVVVMIILSIYSYLNKS